MAPCLVSWASLCSRQPCWEVLDGAELGAVSVQLYVGGYIPHLHTSGYWPRLGPPLWRAAQRVLGARWGLSGCKGRVAAIIRADTGTRGKSEQPKAGTGRAYGHTVASWTKEVLAEAGTGKERGRMGMSSCGLPGSCPLGQWQCLDPILSWDTARKRCPVKAGLEEAG